MYSVIISNACIDRHTQTQHINTTLCILCLCAGKKNCVCIYLCTTSAAGTTTGTVAIVTAAKKKD